MKTGTLFAAFILQLIVWSPQAMAQPAVPQQKIWFQKEVKELLKQDRSTPPPRQAIVFTGSSIFRFWVTLERDMSPLPVVNRAFGGARTWEVLHYMDSLILPLAPSIIVYYCGGNDIESGAAADDIARRFAEFCTRVHASLPKTKIFFVSINKAPQKFEKWSVIDEVNRQAAAYCAQDVRLGFIDSNPAFFNENGQPRRELYIGDGLHFMPDAYRELTKAIKPVLEKAWKELR